MKLVIGYKNYSSWSLRAWLCLQHFGLSFEEVIIPLFQPGYREQLAQYSKALKVPVLVDGPVTVWDSLAICEYVNDTYLEGRAWPADPQVRAVARSASAEMHSGFFAIRNDFPMNCRESISMEPSAEVLGEIARIDALWGELRERFGGSGPYLFGSFSIADCMYAPIASRFRTYGVTLSGISRHYQEALLANPAMQQWLAAASKEDSHLELFEK